MPQVFLAAVSLCLLSLIVAALIMTAQLRQSRRNIHRLTVAVIAAIEADVVARRQQIETLKSKINEIKNRGQ